MDAAWLLVPAAVVLVLFLGASLRSLSPNAGPITQRVASVSFYGCLVVGAVLLLGLMIARIG